MALVTICVTAIGSGVGRTFGPASDIEICEL